MGSLKSFNTLKTSKEFATLYQSGKKWHCKYAVVFYKKTTEKKVGFVASKKVGNAVQRAFSKRRCRAVFTKLHDKLKAGSYVFICKDKIVLSPYNDFEKNIIWSLKKLKCFNNE